MKSKDGISEILLVGKADIRTFQRRVLLRDMKSIRRKNDRVLQFIVNGKWISLETGGESTLLNLTLDMTR